MNEVIKIVLTSLLTSTIFLSILYYIFRKYFYFKIKSFFDNKLELLKFEHNKELEIIKNELEIKYDIRKNIINERVLAYERISKVVYETRNLIKEINNNKVNVNKTLVNNLNNFIQASISLLIQFRIYINDRIFFEVHDFKECVKKYLNYIKIYKNTKQNSDLNNIINDLYKIIDDSCKNIIKNIKSEIEKFSQFK